MVLCACSHISTRNVLQLDVHWHKFAWKAADIPSPRLVKVGL